jgi:hypothetical protein
MAPEAQEGGGRGGGGASAATVRRGTYSLFGFILHKLNAGEMLVPVLAPEGLEQAPPVYARIPLD